MGCDIHIFFEFYCEKTKQWFAIKIIKTVQILSALELEELIKSQDQDWVDYEKIGIEFDTDRGYSLFGLLAGVRWTEVKPLARPRGFPDSSAYYQNNFTNTFITDSNMHHHTYYKLTELINANTKENRENYSYDRMLSIIQPLIEYCEENNCHTDHIRAIICFDN